MFAKFDHWTLNITYWAKYGKSYSFGAVDLGVYSFQIVISIFLSLRFLKWIPNSNHVWSCVKNRSVYILLRIIGWVFICKLPVKWFLLGKSIIPTCKFTRLMETLKWSLIVFCVFKGNAIFIPKTRLLILADTCVQIAFQRRSWNYTAIPCISCIFKLSQVASLHSVCVKWPLWFRFVSVFATSHSPDFVYFRLVFYSGPLKLALPKGNPKMKWKLPLSSSVMTVIEIQLFCWTELITVGNCT